MRINIYIPHHRNPDLLPPLFDSLIAMNQANAAVKIILVDNASNDGSFELVSKKYPDVVIHTFSQNQGFAPALNQVVQVYESDWVCFLNNDMKVDENWLLELVHAAKTTQASCVGSVLMDWGGDNIQMARGRINWFGKGFEEPTIPSDEPYPVFFACGGAMMIHRDVFLETGGFDDNFFMIYEDVDLGWRLWLLGYQVNITPKSRVYHLGHASLKQEDYTRKAVFLERNSLAALYKNLDDSSLSVVFPLAVQEAHVRAAALTGTCSQFPYSSDGMHTANGLHQFLSQLELWRNKRKIIQSKRKISDQELVERFFTNPETPWAYCDDHYHRIHESNSFQQIQSLLSMTSNYITS